MSEPTHKRKKGRPLGAEAEVGREAVLLAARDVLRETPPGQVTRQLVATKAGVDPGLIRYYFGTLENLMAEVAATVNRDLRAQVEGAQAGRSPDERLLLRVAGTFQMFLENPHHHEVMLSHQLGARTDEIKADWRHHLGGSLVDLKDILVSGREAGELREIDERLLHLAIISLGEFFSTSETLLKDMYGDDATIEDLRDPYLRFVEDLLLNGLRPRA